MKRYEFGPSIVWDTLVDADLVAGWLAHATIEPLIGGRFVLRGQREGSVIQVDGRITALNFPASLDVVSNTGVTIQFRLVEVAGGNRGTSTQLSVDIVSPVEAAFAHRAEGEWRDSLDQLADLLHGHPVDWSVVPGVGLPDSLRHHHR